MKCCEIQEQLSAYHDGELASEIAVVVAAHLSDCQTCSSQLAEFASYSHSFSQLSQPSAPPRVWAGIAAELEREPGHSPVVTARTVKNGGRSWLTTGRLALAASLLLVLGFGFWVAGRSDHSGHRAEFMVTMDHYLTTLAIDPDQAERFLLAKYDGQVVAPEEAVRLVGYRPAVASGLPSEYTLASTSVMTMPCCTCVKAVCKRQDGSTLVLFEHDDEETQMLGKRPSSITTCADKECCLVELDSSIAATWKRGSRWLTAVGVRDSEEVSELVTWMETNSIPEPQSI